MKRIIAFVLCLAMLLTLAACGSSDTNGTEDTSNSASSAGGTTAAENTNKETDPAKNTEGSTAPISGNDNEATPTTGDATQPTIGTDATEPTHTHEYTNKVTAPTCTKDGYTTHTCACGNSYVDTKVAATGHKFGDWKTTKKPTATATGTEERKCSNCGTKETRTIGKLIENHTHSYSVKTTKTATCSAEGVKTFTCSCGDSYTESIAKTAHKYKDTVTKPTCTNGGYTTHTCSCGDTYSDNKTSALGHAYRDSVTKPTCTENGYTKHTCSRCGSTYTDSRVSATGHSYAVTSDTATCTRGGTKTETCSKCGHKKTSASSATGHGATREERKEATIESNGYVRQICTVCGATVSEQILEKLPAECQHEWQRVDCTTLSGVIAKFTDWTVNRCKHCAAIDESTYEFKYTQEEAAEIMLGYVNQLRYEVYGTHDYDLQMASGDLPKITQMVAEGLSHEYKHSGLPGLGENIAFGDFNLKRYFNNWKYSPGHYANMIDKSAKYFSFAIYNKSLEGSWAVQHFTELPDGGLTLDN